MAQKRDYILARLSAARNALQTGVEVVDGCIELFISTDDDPEGDDRREAMDVILDAAGGASRSVELAQAVFDKLGRGELLEGEPDDDTEGEQQ